MTEKERKLLASQEWRLNNLYHIESKKGKLIRFKMNAAQTKLYRSMWYFNLILKARQRGISTFISIFFLDCALFNKHLSCGQICDSLNNAKQFLKKIKLAYDNMPDFIKDSVQIENYSKSADDAGIWFKNGSSVRVGTSFRSGTLQKLHVSEYARICRKFPDKANEIKAGALNTIDAGQMIFIESTAEGAEGDFYDKAKKSEQNKGKELSKLDYKFFFFSWWEDEGYKLDVPVHFNFSIESIKYFADLESLGIELSDEQKYWYVKKKEDQGDDMLKEYPSTPDESFKSSTEGKFYYNLMRQLRVKKHMCKIEVDPNLKINTAWDLGMNDAMTIWFYQVFGKEIRIIDYYENNEEGFGHYAKVMREKGYDYGKHYAPFDIVVPEMGTGKTRYESAREHGIKFEMLQDAKGKMRSAVPNMSIEEGIEAVRHILPQCWFNEPMVQRGIECLEKYSKKWNETLGMWHGQKKDEWEQGASSFRYLALVVKNDTITTSALDVMRDRRVKHERILGRRVHPQGLTREKITI